MTLDSVAAVEYWSAPLPHALARTLKRFAPLCKISSEPCEPAFLLDARRRERSQQDPAPVSLYSMAFLSVVFTVRVMYPRDASESLRFPLAVAKDKRGKKGHVSRINVPFTTDRQALAEIGNVSLRVALRFFSFLSFLFETILLDDGMAQRKGDVYQGKWIILLSEEEGRSVDAATFSLFFFCKCLMSKI